MTPLRLPDGIDAACASGDVATIEAWLEAGGAVDALNSINQSLLSLAVIRDKSDLVDRLLDRGADPNAGDWSAFMQAVNVGCLPWVKAMLIHGANPNTMDRHGTLALHEALRLRGDACCAVATCLIEAGADPRLKNAKGLDFLGEMARLGRSALPGNAPHAAAYDALRRLVHTAVLAHDVASDLPDAPPVPFRPRPRV